MGQGWRQFQRRSGAWCMQSCHQCLHPAPGEHLSMHYCGRMHGWQTCGVVKQTSRRPQTQHIMLQQGQRPSPTWRQAVAEVCWQGRYYVQEVQHVWRCGCCCCCIPAPATTTSVQVSQHPLNCCIAFVAVVYGYHNVARLRFNRLLLLALLMRTLLDVRLAAHKLQQQHKAAQHIQQSGWE